jgi:hypothetical protein
LLSRLWALPGLGAGVGAVTARQPAPEVGGELWIGVSPSGLEWTAGWQTQFPPGQKQGRSSCQEPPLGGTHLGGVCQLHQQQHGERQAGQVEHGAEPKEASIAATQRPPPARSPETCSWFGTRLGILRPHFPFHTLKAIYNLLEMANLKTLMLCLCMDNGIYTSILLLIVPVQISYR